ncbi:MAG: NADH-quinone oxidoreductase subunit L [Planctomycetota bacterium]|nr:MAG: NADH-quinone oxidoreductase subunit L [Planctomycetota bacterium]REK18130.1 MAG: NADH-quinone oxidoreductase subunit L [Planctomycetota bacterium]REK44213.1 MAG: NADH-quinone oxidoreductase subunit L [Planctomycetota bacterium]
MIVQELTKLQQRDGYLSDEALVRLADRLTVPLYRIHEVASFFPHFRRQPPPQVRVQVCQDMSCLLRGAGGQLAALQSVWPDGHGDVLIEGVSCLGRCDRAPVTAVNDRIYAARSVEDLRRVVGQTCAGEQPPADLDSELAEVLPDHWTIDPYQDQRSYAAVQASVKDGHADHVIAALETADLLGMGGAGGRSYKKWADVRRAEGKQKYVVCNADESEPGTFKDRELLLRAPHLVIEGMVLGGLVVGATQGYVYIRHEYHEQIEVMREAIDEARRLQICGSDVLGTGRPFELEVFVSPGGYICGEQTALIEALEDKRAEPRNRPPELQTNGLWDKPTLLNNVETFAWVPVILLKEAGNWFAAEGLDGCKGRRFFSISGDVARPGAYEVPNGTRLGDLIDNFAGGMRDGQKLQAVALSGPSGGFLPAEVPVSALSPRFVEAELETGATHFPLRDARLDIRTFRTMGLMLGAGIVVFGEEADLVAQAVTCQRFYRDESCGKCVPCRKGSQRLWQIAGQLEATQPSEATLQATGSLVAELGETMELTSICGLGQVASNPLRTLLQYFPDALRTNGAAVSDTRPQREV